MRLLLFYEHLKPLYFYIHSPHCVILKFNSVCSSKYRLPTASELTLLILHDQG